MRRSILSTSSVAARLLRCALLLPGVVGASEVHQAAMQLRSVALAASIGTQPQSQTVAFGQMANLSVTASGTGLSYQWYQGRSGNTSVPIGGATSSSFTTPALISNAGYWVRASDSGGSVDSNAAVITVSFTDPMLQAGWTAVRAIHVQELRARIDALRSRYSLGAYPYAGVISAGATVIQAVDITQMRNALMNVYNAIPQTAPAYSTAPGAGSPIVVADIAELRSHVTAIEFNNSTFNVVSVASIQNTAVTVTFDAAPNPTQAANPNNYSIPSLSVVGANVNGKVTTLTTSTQVASSYTVTVSGVTRNADGEPLTMKMGSFNGTPLNVPTVSNVVVTATNPNNASTPYNTGTATVTITGTDLGAVVCPGGIKLDDRDGAGVLVATSATSCTAGSDNQVTATFPAGIRTNASTGWNVIATNAAGSNTTSDVKFVPVAGLLISEVMPESSAGTDEEFIEIYNPTGSAIDTKGTGIALHLHIRSVSGTDVDKTLTAITSGVIPSHGFLLIVSAQSTTLMPWFPHRDYTYSAASGDLASSNGGAYVSLSASANAKVLDKLGWGAQPAFGFEGTAAANMSPDNSVQRKPAGGAGHATDTDNNGADFNAPSTTITPRGTADAPQP